MADILFKCPKCTKALAVDATAVGQPLACSDCGIPVEVPLPDIKYRCTSCKADLFSPQELSGETLHCPDCQNAVLVQLSEADYLRKRLKELEQEPKTPVVHPSLTPVANHPPPVPAKKTPTVIIKKPSVPPPAKDLEDGIIRFTCPHCSQHLEAERDMADEKIECPKCKNSIRVPIPAGWKPKPKATAKPATGQTTNNASRSRACVACCAPISSTAIICMHCGTNQVTGQQLGTYEAASSSPNNGIPADIIFAAIAVLSAIVGVVVYKYQESAAERMAVLKQNAASGTVQANQASPAAQTPSANASPKPPNGATIQGKVTLSLRDGSFRSPLTKLELEPEGSRFAALMLQERQALIELAAENSRGRLASAKVESAEKFGMVDKAAHEERVDAAKKSQQVAERLLAIAVANGAANLDETVSKNERKETKSDSQGHFTFGPIPTGQYVLKGQAMIMGQTITWIERLNVANSGITLALDNDNCIITE